MRKTLKKLSLNVESVRNLANVDLQQVVGGGVQTQNRSYCQTNCHASECICHNQTRYYC